MKRIMVTGEIRLANGGHIFTLPVFVGDTLIARASSDELREIIESTARRRIEALIDVKADLDSISEVLNERID